MAFFDSLFSGWSPGGATVASAGLNLAGNLIGGLVGAAGNERAGDIAAQTAERQMQELREGKQRGVAAIDQGVADYSSTVAPMLTERPIMLPTFQGLTKQQELGRGDLLRSGQATLASSGLRGAGRAGVGVVLDQLGRYDAAARGGNDAANLAARTAARGSADATRSGLATVKANAGTAKANTEVGVGSQLAGAIGGAGDAQARLAGQTGQMFGQMAASTGRLAGNTLMAGTGWEQGNSPNQPPVMAPAWGQQQRQPAAGQRV